MKTINRRVFEAITGLIILGLTVGLTFVTAQIAQIRWGYSAWYGLLLLPVFFIVVSAYMLLPFIVFQIAKKLFHVKDYEEEVPRWFVVVNVITWLSVIPIVFIVGLYLSAYFN